VYRFFLKPFLDRVGAFFGLLILSPVLITIAILVRVKLGSPVLFVQIRPGKDEKPFKLYKFRTMTNQADSEGMLLDKSRRMTNFGRKLRVTSLDELPELFNILVGDMSFVGPRPLLMKYLALYNEEQKVRHEVRPGLTGLAQVNGRNSLSWERKFAYDVEYVRTQSFLLDLEILFRTVSMVLKGSGVSSGKDVTMEEFQGSL
jgi:undecaprenyl phosphate N,N'-diacetylbacillosamine 1-phosphate transferase